MVVLSVSYLVEMRADQMAVAKAHLMVDLKEHVTVVMMVDLMGFELAV